MDQILTWGYPGLAVIGFIAGSILPMSSEAALSAAIAMGWPVWPCIFATFAGNWLGASSNYVIGRFASIDWIERHLHIRRAKIDRARIFLRGHGIWLAAVSFLPFLGNALVIGFGVSRTPFWKVGLLMMIGRLARYIGWMYITVGAMRLFE